MNQVVAKLEKEEVKRFLQDANNPVIISFVSPKNQLPIAIPVWAYFRNGKFYVMSSRNSEKVNSIEEGNHQFTLTMVNHRAYPHMIPGEINYIAVSGTTRISTEERDGGIAEVEIELLKKYNETQPEQWALELIQKLENQPEGAWMMEIDPKRVIIKK